MTTRFLIATAVCGVIFCMCAWGLYEFVNLKF
jgi:hypothetical protein